MLSLLHPAVARMLLIGTPPLAAALVLAALMLCGVNLLKSNPASRITSFTHLAIESDVAGPCGCGSTTTKFISPRDILLKYCTNTQSFVWRVGLDVNFLLLETRSCRL